MQLVNESISKDWYEIRDGEWANDEIGAVVDIFLGDYREIEVLNGHNGTIGASNRVTVNVSMDIDDEDEVVTRALKAVENAVRAYGVYVRTLSDRELFQRIYSRAPFISACYDLLKDELKKQGL